MELKLINTMAGSNGVLLLIVPYGIETFFAKYSDFAHWQLLIVPYGIETQVYLRRAHSQNLLIVPYGIETCISYRTGTQPLTFNRTLWN